jgi:hypothetical protein
MIGKNKGLINYQNAGRKKLANGAWPFTKDRYS